MDEMFESPCARYHHDHPPVRDINLLFDERMTFGQRVADRVAEAVGSWPFILVQTALLAAWIAANVYLAVAAKTGKPWDPFPFILLNLLLSFQAAYTGPVVMMSQNRQADKDRLTAQRDFEVDRRAEEEVAVIMEHLLHQDDQIAALRGEIARLTEALQGR